MSHSLNFYKISKITEVVPPIINTDQVEVPFHYVNIDRAKEYEKKFGIPCVLECETVDIFDVCCKIFGERPVSASYSWNYFNAPVDSPYANVVLTLPDGSCRNVSKKEIEKYKYTARNQVLLYNREEIAEIEDGYLIDSNEFEDRPLRRQEILKIAEQFVKEYAEDGEYYGKTLFEIMKAYTFSSDSDCIVCCAE